VVTTVVAGVVRVRLCRDPIDNRPEHVGAGLGERLPAQANRPSATVLRVDHEKRAIKERSEDRRVACSVDWAIASGLSSSLRSIDEKTR